MRVAHSRALAISPLITVVAKILKSNPSIFRHKNMGTAVYQESMDLQEM